MTIQLSTYQELDQWIDAHFDEQVQFLQALVQVPTDTPPGNNAPHAQKTTELLKKIGYVAEQFPVPEAEVKAYGLTSLTNLIVRRPFGAGGKTSALSLSTVVRETTEAGLVHFMSCSCSAAAIC